MSIRNNRQAFAQDLPQELLGEIFVRCLPDNVFDDLQPNSSLPPLVFCRVCSSWRKAALGTPQLWSELTMKLEFICGTHVLHTTLYILEYWGSRMGALLPSLHFRRGDLRRSISLEEASKLVPLQTFFQSPVILNAQSLTLDGFTNRNAMAISMSPVDIPFKNLAYLATNKYTPYQFYTCPTLRRLNVDFHTRRTDRSSRFVHAFSWVTITHLNANLRIGRQDWCTILAQCANMTSCSISLEVWQDANSSNRQTRLHHNLRTLSVRGGTETFTGIFDGFIFPSLVALRLSSTNSTTLKHIHRTIAATPALKEFHLQVLPFQVTDFLRQPQDSHLAGPLSKFAPGLVILVIDRIPSAAQDVPTLLHSSWLNDGWASLSGQPMRVEFIFEDGDLSTSATAVPSFVEDFNREIDRCTPLPFHASARYLPEGLWNWKQLNARELCDRWDDTLCFLGEQLWYSWYAFTSQLLGNS